MPVFENYQGILSEYEVTERSRPQACPMCRVARKLHRHGTRDRYAGYCQIKVGRFRCPACKRTVTVLPRQLLSRFLNPLRDLLLMLKAHLTGAAEACSRQLLRHYLARYYDHESPLILLLRESRLLGWIPPDPKERAAMVITAALQAIVVEAEVLQDTYFAQFKRHLLAKKVYHVKLKK
ncbi:hypothetical protein SDC9_125665 [bioreactor metagenome]|uniref:Uncharacterized protein n=1 Tax=bioreactor metagenome TaxID=1076179 RepID=A0A645CP47_9ZZZZ